MRLGLIEGGVGQRVVVLAGGVGRTRDDAPDEVDPRLLQPLAGVGYERVLAGAARADDGDEYAGAQRERVVGEFAFDQRRGHHATRFPSRQTVRTTGTCSSTRTRTRSARRPISIAPRSASPTASAGFFETIAIACGNEIASTTSPRKNADWIRLNGM